MPPLKKNKAPRPARVAATVVSRRSTLEEQRQQEKALNVLLAELVRQQLGRKQMSDSIHQRRQGKRYIALARASDTSDGTTSTEAQLALLHQYAQANGMVRVDEIVLDGVTGSMPGKRGDLDALLARKAQKDDFDLLIVQRLDRLTRSGSDHGFWIEHQCKRAGIELVVVGDDIPEGRYASLIKVAKYEAAQEQAFSISQRSTQGYQLALEQGRVITSSHTPYACWRLYFSSDGKPLHLIRDLRDGRQQKLDPQTREVIDTYGKAGGGAKGHYRKQKDERVLLVPGDPDLVAIVRDIFDLHYRQGWGGKRIADYLNRRAIRSPNGRQWSQHQVEVIYMQEAYTGRSVGNRVSSAIYHRRQAQAPQRVNLSPSIHATAKTIPIRLRAPAEWFVQDQPQMAEFLGDDDLRRLAIEGQDRHWRHLADPDRPKLSKSKHKTSDYLLTGLLYAKQDNEPLVGILCGRIGQKTRYYRHKRGRRGYQKGAVFNKMIHAETIESAVLGAARKFFLEATDLRDRIIAIVQQQMEQVDAVDLDELKKQRDQLRRKTEMIVSTLDEETLADAQQEIDRLKQRRRELDDQIEKIESTAAMSEIDPERTADAVLERLRLMTAESNNLPVAALRAWLATVVERVVVDLETKDIEIRLMLPSDIIVNATKPAQNTMRLVGISASSTDYETHPFLIAPLAMIDCQFQKASNHLCYDCHRRLAA